MFQDCLQSLQNIASYSFTLSTSSQFGFVLPLGCRLLQPAQSFCPFLLSFLCTHWMQCHSHTALCAFDCAQHNASRTFERSVKAPSFKLPLDKGSSQSTLAAECRPLLFFFNAALSALILGTPFSEAEPMPLPSQTKCGLKTAIRMLHR